MERHAQVNGYPRQDNLMAFLQGAGGGIGRDRILCLDMPEQIALTNIRVMNFMKEPERVAVFLWFVIRIKPDGTEWTVKERCERFHISYDTLRWRVNRARYQFLGLEPPY